jgi:hypothetical protein
MLYPKGRKIFHSSVKPANAPPNARIKLELLNESGSLDGNSNFIRVKVHRRNHRKNELQGDARNIKRDQGEIR